MTHLKLIVLSISLLVCSLAGRALEPGAYAEESVLAQGKWVKVSVEQGGMHLITNTQLQQWGFKTPKDVRIYGYGGAMLADALRPEEYIDDLPMQASEVTSAGIAFYAVGPRGAVMDEYGKMTRTINPYDTKGYYFVTERPDAPLPTPAPGGEALPTGDMCATSGQRFTVEEKEAWSPGGTGRMLLGDDFTTQRRRSYSFPLKGLIAGSEALVTYSFVAKTPGGPSQVSLTYDGEPLSADGPDRIAATTGGDAYYGAQIVKQHTALPSKPTADIEVEYSCDGIVSHARLDYISVQWEAQLQGPIDFHTTEARLQHRGASAADMRIWDVTSPTDIRLISPGPTGAWSNVPGPRHYAVWSVNDASLPSPTTEEVLANQNLHSLTGVPDMVIITHQAFRQAAQTLADLHRNSLYDPLTVEVVDQRQIFNEFGSGTFDPGALRRFLKMLYDRGRADSKPLRYALFFGKGTCDNRRLTAQGRSIAHPVPLWVSEASLRDNESFSTDDYFALLDDYDGTRPQSETLDIAVGRIPSTTAQEALDVVEKIKRYIASSPRDSWRTRFTVLADDENEGVHMLQAEAMLKNLESSARGNRFTVNKVYCDAYSRANSTYPQAREELFAHFADGTSLFAFIGHGSPTALGSKNIITPVDFRDRFHLRRLPFFYTATCNFLKWDSDITSMAEQLMLQKDGGIIGCIAALRPVFITQNGRLTACFGTALGSLADDGRELTAGELYRRAKNLLNNDSNKLRYVLMGDPAMRLSYAGYEAELLEVNGRDASEETVDVAARQVLELTGRITDGTDSLLADFDGQITATLYDADHSTTSRGYGDGKHVTFEEIGSRLFVASGKVERGLFNIKVQMPAAIENNYRPTTLSLYAHTPDGAAHAMGRVRTLYATGYDETSPGDDTPPVIHAIGLNTLTGFEQGSTVNENPMLMAAFSDNSGINMSSAGIGRLISIIVDGNEFIADANRYFVPDAEPTAGAMSGTLNYPLQGLAPGPHEVTLRVWDIADNYAQETLAFNVKTGMKPEIFGVSTDANPASEVANFYITHNRPDQVLSIRLGIYDLLGRQVWATTTESRSDLDRVGPIHWPLTDMSGERVGRGIYLYRAEISTDGETFVTSSRKIAVTASSHE